MSLHFAHYAQFARDVHISLCIRRHTLVDRAVGLQEVGLQKHVKQVPARYEEQKIHFQHYNYYDAIGDKRILTIQWLS